MDDGQADERDRKDETRNPRKVKHESPNYALERYGEKSSEGTDVWFEIKDGFVSVRKALEYAESQKIEGAVRVVRVASPVFGGSLVRPDPIYMLKRIDAEKAARVPRRRASKLQPPASAAEPIPPEAEAEAEAESGAPEQ